MPKHRPLYRAVLKDAFTLTLKNKHLWPLGLFAGMLLTGSAYDLLSRSWHVIIGARLSGRIVGGVPESVFLLTETLSRGAPWGERAPLWVVGASLGILLLLALVIWLSVVSQGALLSAVAADEEHKRPNLQQFFAKGVETFWPLFFLNVLVRVAVGVLVLAVSALVVPAVVTNAPLWNASAVLAFVLLMPVAFAAVTLTFFAAMEVVRFRNPLLAAIRRSWSILVKHWLVVLETSALVLVIDALVAVGIVLAGVVFSAPFFLLFVAATALGSAALFWTVFFLYLLGLVILTVGIVAAAITYHYAVWGILLERLRKGTAKAKILRVAHTLAGAFRPK